MFCTIHRCTCLLKLQLHLALTKFWSGKIWIRILSAKYPRLVSGRKSTFVWRHWWRQPMAVSQVKTTNDNWPVITGGRCMCNCWQRTGRLHWPISRYFYNAMWNKQWEIVLRLWKMHPPVQSVISINLVRFVKIFKLDHTFISMQIYLFAACQTSVHSNRLYYLFPTYTAICCTSFQNHTIC